MTQRTEVPETAGIAKIRASAEDTYRAIAMTPPCVLHVDVIDAATELADEFHVVDALIAEGGRVVVETETLVVLHRLERALRGGDVERDFGGVHLKGEVHVLLVEGIEDGRETLREILKALVVESLARRRERVEAMPDRGAGEAVDHRGELVLVLAAGFRVQEKAGGLAGLDHLQRRALADTFGLAVAPDIRRQDRLVALVDIVADRLANEVAGDRVGSEAVVGKKLPLLLDVVFLGDGRIDIKVIAPAGELKAVVAHFRRKRREFLKRKIGPLAGEECDWSGHVIKWVAVGLRAHVGDNRPAGEGKKSGRLFDPPPLA